MSIKLTIHGCLLLICSAGITQAHSESEQDSFYISRTSVDEIILTRQLTTHKRNYLINFETLQLTYIGDGDTVRLADGTFLNNWAKSYFNGGGAFWYSTLRNKSGELAAVLDHPEANNCIPYADFKSMLKENLRQLLSKANKKEFCVWSK